MGLLDLSDRPHLFDGRLDLLRQELLLRQRFSLGDGGLALLRAVKGLEGLQVLALDPVVNLCQPYRLPFRVSLVDVQVGLSFAKLLPLEELFNFIDSTVVPLVRIDVITYKGQPHCVVMDVVPDLRRISILQVCPHVLVVEY